MKTLNLKLFLVTLDGAVGKKSDGDKNEAKAVIAYSLSEAIGLIEADPDHREATITKIEEHRAIDYLTDRSIDFERFET